MTRIRIPNDPKVENQLKAKIILLSKKGVIYVPAGQLKLPGKDNTPETIEVIRYNPYCPDQIALYTRENDRFYSPRDDEEKERIYSFILRKYNFPDDNDMFEDELEKHLQLRMKNISFISEHGDLNKKDFMKMDSIMVLMEHLRFAKDQTPIPHSGDTVEGNVYGRPFTKGIIVTHQYSSLQEEINICAEPYQYPFVTKHEDGTIEVESSGGPFLGCSKEKLEHIGTDIRYFHVWGHEGPCGNGAICFPVTVNKWKLTEKSI